MNTRCRHPDRLDQSTLLKAAADLVKKKFGCTVYSDEVLKNFGKPCFFAKLIATTRQQAKYIVRKTISIIFTYFPSENKKNEINYMETYETMHALFAPGFKAGSRYLHTSEISQGRVGEDEDILQVTINLSYLDYLDRPKSDVMIGDVEFDVKNVHGKNDEEIVINTVNTDEP